MGVHLLNHEEKGSSNKLNIQRVKALDFSVKFNQCIKTCCFYIIIV